MNTLCLLAGTGAGALVTVVVFLWTVAKVKTKAEERAEAQNKLTAELMKERNEIDKKKVLQLNELAMSVDRLCREVCMIRGKM